MVQVENKMLPRLTAPMATALDGKRPTIMVSIMPWSSSPLRRSPAARPATAWAAIRAVRCQEKASPQNHTDRPDHCILPVMPHINSHPHGSFVWTELGTSDQAAAKTFYGALFGWHANDMPMGPDEYYTIFRLEGRDAAAAHTLHPEYSGDAPPNWGLYISVADADASAARVTTAGGKVMAPPFDVSDAGRMAVV